MNEYEVCIEEINPCGGSRHSTKNIIEVEAVSPEDYVRKNGRFPIVDITEGDDDVTITTADGNGYIIKYIFS